MATKYELVNQGPQESEAATTQLPTRAAKISNEKRANGRWYTGVGQIVTGLASIAVGVATVAHLIAIRKDADTTQKYTYVFGFLCWPIGGGIVSVCFLIYPLLNY